MDAYTVPQIPVQIRRSWKRRFSVTSFEHTVTNGIFAEVGGYTRPTIMFRLSCISREQFQLSFVRNLRVTIWEDPSEKRTPRKNILSKKADNFFETLKIAIFLFLSAAHYI